MALLFHPDKNSHPAAEDAFKTISKAFSVLSDPEKRYIYDNSGGLAFQDGDVSNGCSQSQPFAHFNGSPMFAHGEPVSPEELFNFFFAHAFNQSMYEFLLFFHYKMAGDNFRDFNFTQQRRRRRPTDEDQHQHNGTQRTSSLNPILIQLAPLLFFILLNLLSSALRFLFGGGSGSYYANTNNNNRR